ncbi:MAG: AAA family ATPase [Desulfobacterales bacterium]|nr:MAG: AAA family ATPase [Desulfobacterales bacterium]
MKCRKCQFENPAGAKFCNECGNKLDLACTKCGHVNPSGSKFCNECGRNLAQPSAPSESSQTLQQPGLPTALPETVPLPEGERRQATIVFSDLSGYTSMNERLDPEEVEAIMSRIKKEAVRIVERHEGIVNQFVGDEVLALFGIPAAHEDDPVRAVKAAFEIHELVSKISPEVEARIGTRLRMHTGISTGLVVTHLRDIRDGSYGITGDTVNIGARLAARAEADEILVGPETNDLVTPYFKTKALESIAVRGKTKPLIPYFVIGESAVQTRFEAAKIHGLTSFTGREHELTALYSCLEKALAGMGQFVTVVGEAGLGKSRLIHEFSHSLNRSEITVVQGRCQSYGKSIPYFPHINALRRGLKLSDEDTPLELHEKAVSNVLAVDPSLEKYLPVYLHLLSIPSGVYPLPQHLQGQELTLAIQEAIVAIFILNAKNRPTVLVFEDWHWVDEASDSTIKHIISLIAPHPLMVVVIYRPEFSTNWGNWSHHTPIILNALDRLNCENIIKSSWKADEVPQKIITLVHEQTGGNPFFVEEISSELIESGTVEVSDRQAVLKQSVDNLTLPNTVQAVIRARLDRLDHRTRESLRLASVIGREFARRILEQISDSTERLSESLDTLKVMELIQQIQIVPEAQYMFKHVITQEVTYETLLKQKRKELHSLVGRAIEKLYADRLEEFFEMLAFHYRRAEDWSLAYRYNRDAGLKAQSLSAYIETLNFLETALKAVKKLPRSKIHLEQEIDLRHHIRSALFPLGRHDDWADHVRKAELLAREINDDARLAKCYNYLSSHHWINGRNKEAIALCEEGLRLAEATGDFSVEITSRFHLGIPLLYTGEFERQVILHREVAERLSGPAALERHGLSSVPSVAARGLLTWGLSELGEFEEAEMWSMQGGKLAGQVMNLFSTAFMHACSGLSYLRKGELDTALKFLQDANTLVRDADIQSIFSFAAASLAHTYLLSGRPDDALSILEEAVKPQNLDSSILSSVYPITALSEAFRLNGQLEKAFETAEEALRIFRQTEERCFGAWTLLVMAKIQSENGSDQIEQAPQSYLQAKDLAAKLKMRPLLAHCCLEFGRFYARRGESEKARSELMKAVDLYRSLGMRFWQPKAEAALRGLPQAAIED